MKVDSITILILSILFFLETALKVYNKGIDKSRLSAKGYGESQLSNRCANGVECSDAEHKQNRRTVFKISYVGN